MGINSEKVEKIIDFSAEDSFEDAVLRAERYTYFFIDKKTAMEMGREMRETIRNLRTKVEEKVGDGIDPESSAQKN